MKILVAAKRVVDHAVRIRVRADGTGVDTDTVKMSINPFDEIAVEEAVRLREQGVASSVTVVSIGSEASAETLRHGLALGADQGILIRHAGMLHPLAVARLLAAIVARTKPDLVLLGKQSIDGDNGQTGQMLAALLGWPQATFASRITPDGDGLTVVREVDGGLETVAVSLPAVVTTDLRLNEPRYASLPNIMKAKKKPIETLAASDLGVDLGSQLQLVSVVEPARRSAGRRVESTAELIAAIRQATGRA